MQIKQARKSVAHRFLLGRSRFCALRRSVTVRAAACSAAVRGLGGIGPGAAGVAVLMGRKKGGGGGKKERWEG